jgi:hypothetical protein
VSNRIGQENRMAHKVVATTHSQLGEGGRRGGGGGNMAAGSGSQRLRSHASESPESWLLLPPPRLLLPFFLSFFNSPFSIRALYSRLACEAHKSHSPATEVLERGTSFTFFFLFSTTDAERMQMNNTRLPLQLKNFL